MNNSVIGPRVSMSPLRLIPDNVKHETLRALKQSAELDFNLVEIHGSWFDQYHLGVKRDDMPQLSGVEQMFVDWLKANGTRVRTGLVDPLLLKPTQCELSGAKIHSMLETLRLDPYNKKIRAPILVSRGGYICDGHHRMFAIMCWCFQSDMPTRVRVISPDLDALPLLEVARTFLDSLRAHLPKDK